MSDKFWSVLQKVFGSRNERLIKGYDSVVAAAAGFEEQIKQLSDDELGGKTAEFKGRIADGEKPENLIAEAFAVVRETAVRHIEMRHYDVQLIGGSILFEGRIAEMATGEGKTLVAPLAAYMVHLTGRGVHLVTVNDYLAKRDAEWMRPVYESLGMTVGAIQSDMDSRGEDRKAQYECDITYGTNNEFGFDYLRDNMKMSLRQMVQSKLDYAIVDEVDSILIDEARTPLIISGPAFDDTTRYKKADAVARQILTLQSKYDGIKQRIDAAERKIANAQGEYAEAKREKDSARLDKATKVIEASEAEHDELENKLENTTQYYEVEVDRKAIRLTHEGVGAAQEIAGIGSFFTGANMEWPHLMEQSLRAHVVFEREKDYVVMDDKVVIVDEFTGRLMQGRQWSDGLHQSVEAKENVQVKEETQTLATITLQNFFKLYGQISGMTGTALTEAEEFMTIYGLDVAVLPTNQPCMRNDMEDMIYKTTKEKFEAIASEINDMSLSGRPVLVGTISIERSEAISNALTRNYGLEHEVLNAKFHEREAVIVAKAGEQHTDRQGKTLGNVTIATNMAGRGTDIKLGEGVADAGGLHILGTERHESRRIDNQLRGRAGRQGDNGSSQFFLCFEDELMSIFAPEWTIKALSWIGWQEGEPIANKRISKGIEKAQKKVEERNYEIRKSLLEYDEVMDYQRKTFYSGRRKILSGKGLRNLIEGMIESVVDENCANVLDKDYATRCIIEWARTNFDVELRDSDIVGANAEQIEIHIKEVAKENAANDISISMGEYIEDTSDSSTWDIQGICKWAMSSFSVSLSAGKIKHEDPEEIEERLKDAAGEQIDKKECNGLSDFFHNDYGVRMFSEWVSSKFDIKLDVEEFKELRIDKIREKVMAAAADRYSRREVEYPVEFAMNMVYGGEETNIYGYESLVKWANKKYDSQLRIEDVQDLKQKALESKLLEMSREFCEGGLERLVEGKLGSLDVAGLVEWANERFDAEFDEESIGATEEERKEKLLEAGKEFSRRELSDLERYVLLQVYDSSWKDHLYVMDHLKNSIHFRAWAEKDPKTEYKREGYKLFEKMQDNIEERVTDIIFKVHIGAEPKQKRSVWNVSSTSHDEVGQFAMAEKQRAAAQAPQGEKKIKQIVTQVPKVGRNEPCPCGSGKKYKKCCGKNE